MYFIWRSTTKVNFREKEIGILFSQLPLYLVNFFLVATHFEFSSVPSYSNPSRVKCEDPRSRERTEHEVILMMTAYAASRSSFHTRVVQKERMGFYTQDTIFICR